MSFTHTLYADQKRPLKQPSVPCGLNQQKVTDLKPSLSGRAMYALREAGIETVEDLIHGRLAVNEFGSRVKNDVFDFMGIHNLKFI